MTDISLINEEVLNSYHDEDRNIKALHLYPQVPEDIRQWAEQVIPNLEAREEFLRNIGEEYFVEIMIDGDTGYFEIGGITFYPKTP